MRNEQPDDYTPVSIHRTFHAHAVAILSAMGFSKEEIAYITEPDDESNEWNVLPIDCLVQPAGFNHAKDSEPETVLESPPEIPYSPEAMLGEVFRIARKRSHTL